MRSVRATRSTSVFTLVTLASLLATVAGCSAESGAAGSSGTAGTVRAADSIAASQVAKASDSPADHPGHGRGPHPGGPDFLLVAALNEPIELTADQKTTIEGLLAANKPSGPHPFDKTRASALAAGVRAGKVDTTAAPPPPDDAAMAARRTAAATALTTLHSTLTSKQRRALVDAVDQKGAQRAKDEETHGRGPDGGPGWGPGHDRHGGDPHGDGGPLEHLLEGLDVTAAQQAQIKARLEAQRPAPPTDADRQAMKTQHEAMRAAMQAKLETFAGDTFDATAFVTPPVAAMKPGDHPDRFLTDIAIVTSVLDAAQREKLAARIEAGPPTPAATQAPAR